MDLPGFVQEFSIKMVIYLDQHFLWDRDPSKRVEIHHGPLRIRDKIFILDKFVSVTGNVTTEFQVIWKYLFNESLF